MSEAPKAPPIETVYYSDGSSATGPGLLPRLSGEQQAAMDTMVDRFLRWSLPDSVRPAGVTGYGGFRRSGADLLTATEARQMLEHVLAGTVVPSEPWPFAGPRSPLSQRRRHERLPCNRQRVRGAGA
jgi:hypothetical protein